MPNKIKLSFLPISIMCVIYSTLQAPKTNAAATNGADIYCFMRNGGNNHEPSWQAAYQFIKNKKQGLFKTSPKQAASFIVEAVVQDPVKYKDCINYLGDLYTGDSTPINLTEDEKMKEEIESSGEVIEKTPKGKYIDRYNY